MSLASKLVIQPSKVLSLILFLFLFGAVFAQDMIYENYEDGTDFWLMIAYNQLVFHADGGDSPYQVSVEVKASGKKAQLLFNERLVIPKRDWLAESGIPVRFSAKLNPGTYNVSIDIKNLRLGGKQNIKRQIKISDKLTELGMPYLVVSKEGVDFIPASPRKIPAEISGCRIKQRFHAAIDSVGIDISGRRLSILRPGDRIDADLSGYLSEMGEQIPKLSYYEGNIYYHMEPFLFSPWFSYDLRYNLKDQIAQIRYIATQAEWKVLRKVPSDRYGEAIEQFWSLHDPSPGTVRNEAREQFYQRVITADERYSIHKKLKGWVSDRGRIYIKYGEPDEIVSESLPLDAYPHIVWYYYGPNREFIFADVGGYGQYQLRNKDEEFDEY